jgi:hypothetical protein
MVACKRIIIIICANIEELEILENKCLKLGASG